MSSGGGGGTIQPGTRPQAASIKPRRMQATRPHHPGRRRLVMLLEPGVRFRLFGHGITERTYEIAGFRRGQQYLLADHPDARVLLRHAGSSHMPSGYGERHSSVERWILRELDRGGWPWP